MATALGLTASQATSRTPFDADWQAKTSLTRDRITIDVHFELNSALNRGLCGDVEPVSCAVTLSATRLERDDM